MAQVVLLDTGPLVAMLDKREQWHSWAITQMRQVQTPLLTCEPVITETCFLLRHLPIALQQLHHWAAQGMLHILPLANGNLAPALALMEHYANVPMSFADASLVKHSEVHPEAHIFTLDSDFTIYRRADGTSPPLLAPFAD